VAIFLPEKKAKKGGVGISTPLLFYLSLAPKTRLFLGFKIKKKE